MTGRLTSKVVVVTGAGPASAGRSRPARLPTAPRWSSALEGAGRGVRVNALVTGNADTPLYRRLIGAPAEGDLPGPAPNPTGRVADPDEIAAFVAFLFSGEAAFITGAALAIDGGSTAQ